MYNVFSYKILTFNEEGNGYVFRVDSTIGKLL